MLQNWHIRIWTRPVSNLKYIINLFVQTGNESISISFYSMFIFLSTLEMKALVFYLR